MTTPTILRVNGEAWLVIHDAAEVMTEHGLVARVKEEDSWLRYPLAVDGEGEPRRCQDECYGHGDAERPCDTPACNCGGTHMQRCPSPLCLHGWERLLLNKPVCDQSSELEAFAGECPVHGGDNCLTRIAPPIRMTADEALELGMAFLRNRLDGYIAEIRTIEPPQIALARHILGELRKRVTP